MLSPASAFVNSLLAGPPGHLDAERFFQCDRSCSQRTARLELQVDSKIFLNVSFLVVVFVH